MRYYFEPWRKYASFKGRASRQEYWIFLLVNFVILFVLMYFVRQARPSSSADLTTADYVAFGFMVAVLLPTIAATVRRLHDTGRSGGWFFITFIPGFGVLLLFGLTVISGDHGPNKYGDEPDVPATVSRTPSPTG